MKRVFNIIERAVFDFGMEVDMSDSMEDIFCKAQNVIDENVEYDYISVCETSNHHQHLWWEDGNGFNYENDGELINGDYRDNHYFRFDEDTREFKKIDWFDATDKDYILMDFTIDTLGRKVALISL